MSSDRNPEGALMALPEALFIPNPRKSSRNDTQPACSAYRDFTQELLRLHLGSAMNLSTLLGFTYESLCVRKL